MVASVALTTATTSATILSSLLSSGSNELRSIAPFFFPVGGFSFLFEKQFWDDRQALLLGDCLPFCQFFQKDFVVGQFECDARVVDSLRF